MQVPEGTVEVYFQRNTGGSEVRWCYQENKEMRKGWWRSSVSERGGQEAVDPIQCDFVAGWGKELREEKGWCRACLERRKVWEVKESNDGVRWMDYSGCESSLRVLWFISAYMRDAARLVPTLCVVQTCLLRSTSPSKSLYAVSSRKRASGRRGKGQGRTLGLE